MAVILVSYLALVPIAYLLWGTFFDGNSVTLRFFQEAYAVYGLGTLIGNTLIFGFGSTALGLAIGIVLAYLTVRTDMPLKSLLFASTIIPLIMPGILQTIAFIFLLSPRIGIVNHWLEPLFGPDFFNVYSLGGMIVVEGLSQMPMVYLLMFAAFRSMDPSLEESALVSGARLPTVLRRITLPAVKPGIYAAILIISIRAIEAFETPALLGIPANVWVFTSRIWRVVSEFPPNYGHAGAYSLSLLALVSIGILWQSRLTKRSKAFQTVTGKGFRPTLMPLGKARWPMAGIVFVFFFVTVLLPLAVLAYTSFMPFYAVPSAESFSRFTIDNYQSVLGNPIVNRALRNSVILAVGTATSLMFVMAIISWVVVRTKAPGRFLIDNLAFLPLAIPSLVLGVAILFVYLRVPLPIYGTLWILFIAYFTKYMPYGIRFASASMYQVANELEESAQASGATWWQTFRRIILPLILPGVLTGWLYIVIVSVRELSNSILLYSPGNEVLAVLIWEQWENGQFTAVAAVGCLLTASLLVVAVIALKLGSRAGVKIR